MMNKINIDGYTICGYGTFDECIVKIDQQFNDFFENVETDYEYFEPDDIYMECFIDYAPDCLYNDDDDDNDYECDYPFIFIIRDDLSEIFYIWLDLNTENICIRKLLISDGKYGYTVNKCIDLDDDNEIGLPNDVFGYLQILCMDMCSYYGV